MRKLTPILIAGATAVGKSEVALRIAERAQGEIVSVDSMQVYRGLDIGTAKPTSDERARVAHHLVDVAELTENFDAGRFVRLASQAVEQIQSRGQIPILCGGTGLYFKAFLEGLSDVPPADPSLRATLEATSLDELLKELEARDPIAYARIDRQNPRRVVRAIEVIRLTGKPFSAQRADWSGASPVQAPTPFFYYLSRTAADLRGRIDRRVDEMFRRGLVDETRELLRKGLAENRTAQQALGYRQVTEFLRGDHSLEETIELVKIRTRQVA